MEIKECIEGLKEINNAIAWVEEGCLMSVRFKDHEVLRFIKRILEKLENGIVDKNIKILKENIRLKFCFYKLELDKTKWKHPDNVCLPAVIEEDIKKFATAIITELTKE